VVRRYTLTTRFQCVNWISWKRRRFRRDNLSSLLASNALIGLVGNHLDGDGMTLGHDRISLPMR